MKTVVITGGNSGLGYYCAQQLAQDPEIYLLLACRNLQKATQAVLNIKKAVNTENIAAMNLDLASLDSIRSFTVELAVSEVPPLGGIVCNAGVQFVQRQTYTRDGFDTTFGVNHLGHFLLVNLLLQQLVTPARIVFVSSDTHDSSKTTGMPEPYWRDPYLMAYPEKDPALKNKNISTRGRIAYTTSKLCNVLCAYELSRRLQQPSFDMESQLITVNVFNPGLMPGSGLAADYTAMAKFVWRNILPLLCRFIPNVNTIEDSGTALAQLITNPKLANVTGKYFSGFKMMDSSQESYDELKAKQLWNASVELTQLKPVESFLSRE